MVYRKFTRNILFSASVLGLLTSCAIFEKKDSNEQSNWIVSQFEKDGSTLANKATFEYSQGNFPKAEEYVLASLKENPRQTQALMVGALVYEKIGRPNRARQYYEDLIVINGPETTILGTNDMIPQKMSEIAKKRLRLINIKQSEIIVEDKEGSKVFNISDEASKRQSRSAIEMALFKREQKKIAENQPSTAEEIQAVEILFSDNEQNMISRFLILKELAEKDLITKEEFLQGRMSNIGGLLPLTNTPPAYGIDKAVPSPDLIIERIGVLKDAVEARAITPREFSAERNLIIEALLPPTPRTRARSKAPAKDILGAAKDLRKLEILSDLNLITSKEKEKEQKAIEKHLGINKIVPVKKEAVAPALTKTEVVETKVEVVEQAPTAKSLAPAIVTEVIETESAPTMIVPDVSSPF